MSFSDITRLTVLMFTIPMRKSVREVNKFEFKSRPTLHIAHGV